MKQKQKEGKKIPPEAWEQISETEILQLKGVFEDLRNSYERWESDSITDKRFVVNAHDGFKFLERIIEKVIESLVTLVDEVSKKEK